MASHLGDAGSLPVKSDNRETGREGLMRIGALGLLGGPMVEWC
jgi:hypothetical protein